MTFYSVWNTRMGLTLQSFAFSVHAYKIITQLFYVDSYHTHTHTHTSAYTCTEYKYLHLYKHQTVTVCVCVYSEET